MLRSAILIAAAALSATAAGATPPGAENGAVAGRSPHRAFHAVADRADCGRPAMHSVPAGKGHVWGTHAMPSAPCAAVESAAVNDRGVRRD